MHKRIAVLPICFMLLLLLMAWVIYAEGLNGGFLFDDFGNLPVIGATGPVDTWPTFWRYITSGSADPTGRPLTLLTFLIDARTWPADPYSFKRTNLILHLLNGVLLALLLRRLGREVFGRANRNRTDWASVLGAGFWLLHPLFVSTTLYIVQREAMLPATFTLLGLLAWLHGRRKVQLGQHLRGALWIGTGLGGCTLLAVLSKANGILLPALALVVEYVLLRSSSTSTEKHLLGATHLYRWVMLSVAWLPAVLVAVYLLQQGWDGLTRGISSVRSWTLGQRLLTEPRILFDYLDLLWLPRPFTPGLFNDHIQASTSLWSPMSTLPAILAMFGLLAGAWILRRRWPAVALGIIFYFVGQSLESSTLALELYFEHRNYLPAMLMFWPLALWLCGLSSSDISSHPALPAQKKLASCHKSGRIAKLALAAILLIGIGAMTHASANLWGNSHDQALLWAKLNPASPRAQANAAQVELSAGQPTLAVNRLLGPLARAPDQVQLALNLFGAECARGQIDTWTLTAARTAMRTTRDPGTLLTSWFERAMDQVAQPPCSQLSYATLNSLLQAALANPYLATNPGRQQDIHYLLGRLALIQHDPNTALIDFNRALDLQASTSVALKQAALLGASGFPRQGLAHLDHLAEELVQGYEPGFGMPRIHAWVLRREQYWPKELAHLRATLRDDAAKQMPKTQ